MGTLDLGQRLAHRAETNGKSIRDNAPDVTVQSIGFAYPLFLPDAVREAASATG